METVAIPARNPELMALFGSVLSLRVASIAFGHHGHSDLFQVEEQQRCYPLG